MPTRKTESDPTFVRRKKQFEELQSLIPALEDKFDLEKRKLAKDLGLLESVASGLYDEVDKLSKKSPADPATDLLVDQVNEFIQDAKLLMTNDAYVQRQKLFVPAGDNPQHRDVLLVLRQVRQGLTRFKQNMEAERAILGNTLSQARTIKAALDYYLEERSTPDREKIVDMISSVSSEWVTQSYPHYFNFDRLDKISLASYFSVSDEQSTKE
jgi:hypothetical protein